MDHNVCFKLSLIVTISQCPLPGVAIAITRFLIDWSDLASRMVKSNNLIPYKKPFIQESSNNMPRNSGAGITRLETGKLENWKPGSWKKHFI